MMSCLSVHEFRKDLRKHDKRKISYLRIFFRTSHGRTTTRILFSNISPVVLP